MTSSPASTSRYILTTLAIILVITAFVLVALNAMNLDRSFGSVLGSGRDDESYKAGYLAARAKYLGPPLEDQRTLLGVVISNDGKKLVVRATSLDTDLIVDGISDERTITTSASTTVRAEEDVPPEDLAAMIASQPDIPPAPFRYKTIRLQDIPVGSRVNVTSAVPLRLLKTIQATEVTLIP